MLGQATEEELFGLFSPIGEILELYILRNSNGKSRGCAFVTYANKFLAQQAITQLNGKQVRAPQQHCMLWYPCVCTLLCSVLCFQGRQPKSAMPIGK